MKHTVVAVGTWLYDGVVPRRIEILSRPAEFSWLRYDYDGQLDSSRPIPRTADGHVYYVGVTGGGEFLSLEDAKQWAEAQPWGPVTWARA